MDSISTSNEYIRSIFCRMWKQFLQTNELSIRPNLLIMIALFDSSWLSRDYSTWTIVAWYSNSCLYAVVRFEIRPIFLQRIQKMPTSPPPFSVPVGEPQPMVMIGLGANPLILVFSILIAVFGIFANSISLSYFIKKVRSDSDPSTARLFAALNICDLLVSVSSAIEWVLLQYLHISLLSIVSDVNSAVNMISLLMTGFLTCLLAVVRAVQLVFPFHFINWRAINLSIAVYSFIPVVMEVLFLTHRQSNLISYKIRFLITASVFVIVVLGNATSLLKLYLSQSSQKETREAKKRATVTVAIVSVIYCVCNVGFILITGTNARLYPRVSMPPQIYVQAVDTMDFILLPLNSACNPVIYLIRNQNMRVHVKRLWRRASRCECRDGRRNNVSMDLSAVGTQATVTVGTNPRTSRTSRTSQTSQTCKTSRTAKACRTSITNVW